MKKIINLFIMLILMSVSLLEAQTYLPLYKVDTTTWNLYGEWGGPFIENANVITQNNDTIINVGVNFQFKISKTNLNDKAWLELENGVRFLVFDLTLSKGDTFNYYTFSSTTIDLNESMTVDTVYNNLDGLKVIEFNTVMSDGFSFIEGVGPSNFFTGGFQMIPFPNKIICKNENGNVLYQQDGYFYEDCQLKTTPIIDYQEIKIIYNNPFNEKLVVEMNDNIEAQVEIIDVNGQLVFKNSFKKQTTINTVGFNNGVYFLLLNNKIFKVVKY